MAIQLIGTSGGKAPATGQGRIDPATLTAKVKAWNPTPEALAATRAQQAAAQQAAQAAQVKNAGATGFWGRIQTVGKGMVKGVVASEQAVAKPVARLLPGGQNDLKEENKQIDQNIKNTQLANRLIRSPNPKDVAFGKKLLSMNKQNQADTSVSVNETAQDIKDSTSKGRIVAGVVGTAADILTAGGAELAKTGGKYAVEEGVRKVATGKVTKKIAEDGLYNGGKKAAAASLAGGGAVSGGASAASAGGDKKQMLEAAAGGALLPVALGGAAKLFKNGSKAALEKIRGKAPEAPPSGAMHDVMSPEAADQAAASAHTKIGVDDLSTKPQPVGVKTPVRPGVKEVSTTDKINVRTPQKMSDDEFHAEFNKLSKGYDQEHAALQKDAKSNAPADKLPSRDINDDIAPTTQQAKITKAAKPDQPTVDGYHHSSELVQDHAQMMKQIDEHTRGGVKIPNQDGDGYVRTSEHTPFYREYFAANGKAPSMAAYKENAAKELTNGKAPYGMGDTYKKLTDRESGKPYDPKLDTKPNAGVTTSNLTTRQQVLAHSIDAKYEKAMNDLIDRYHSPELSAPKAPKTIQKSTSPAGKTTGGTAKAGEKKLSQMGGKRPQNATQTDLEIAHNAGNKAEEAKAAAKLGDPALAGKSTVSRGAGKIFMQAQKDGKPISMDEARARANSGSPAGAKVSGSARNLETRAVEKKLLERSDDLPEYGSMNMKEQAQRATDLISNDPAKALAIATGREGAPTGLHPMSVLKALEHQASKNGDGETLRQLSMSPLHVEASKSAQTLRTLAEKDPDSPLGAMKSISDKRAAAYEKRAGKSAEKAVNETAGKYAKEVDSHIKTPSKDEWKVFLESIKC